MCYNQVDLKYKKETKTKTAEKMKNNQLNHIFAYHILTRPYHDGSFFIVGDLPSVHFFIAPKC